MAFSLRLMWRFRISFLVSFTALSLAFGLGLVTLLAFKELVFSDNWISGADRVYVVRTAHANPGWSGRLTPSSALGLADEFAARLAPGAVAIDYVSSRSSVRTGTIVAEWDVTLVPDSFIDFVNFPVRSGRMSDLKGRSSAAALSRSAADQMFAGEEAVGATLILLNGDKEDVLEVVAVFDDLPDSSLFKTDIIRSLPADYLERTVNERGWMDWQTGGAMQSLVLLPPDESTGATPVSFAAEDGEALLKSAGADFMWTGEGVTIRIQATPLIGFRYRERTEAETNSFFGYQADNVMLLPSLAALIMVLASVSHIGLMTSVAQARLRELAMRRVLGAGFGRLFTVLAAEALTIVLLAYGAATLVAANTADHLYVLTRVSVSPFALASLDVLALGLAISCAVGLLTLLVPVFVVLKFRPAEVLQSTGASLATGGGLLSQVLVFLQCAVGAGLSFYALILFAQITYAQSLDPGFQSAHLVSIRMHRLTDEEKAIAGTRLLAAFEAQPSVLATATLSGAPFGSMRYGGKAVTADDSIRLDVRLEHASKSYLDILGITPIAGRFPDAIATGTWRQPGAAEQAVDGTQTTSAPEGEQTAKTIPVAINMRLLKGLGLETPEAALGYCFYNQWNPAAPKGVCHEIVAVVGDVAGSDAHQRYQPRVYRFEDPRPADLWVKLDGARLEETRDRLQAIWQDFFPHHAFHGSFVDEALENTYAAQRALSYMSLAVAFASMLIAGAAVFAMSRQMVNRRAREVALRRVLGAPNRAIVLLIGVKVSRPAVLGIALGMIPAWQYGEVFLAAYTERAELDAVLWAQVFVGLVAALVFAALSELVRLLRMRPARVLYHE